MLASREANASAWGDAEPSKDGDVGLRQLAGVLGADGLTARCEPDGGACQEDEEIDSMLPCLPRCLAGIFSLSMDDEPEVESRLADADALELFCKIDGRLRSPDDFSSAAIWAAPVPGVTGALGLSAVIGA